MASKQIKFKNLNVKNLISYIETASAGKFNHTFEFSVSETGSTVLECRAFPQDKSFIKYTAVNSADILMLDQLPDDNKSLKVPIYTLDKLKSALKVIEDSKIEDTSGFIEYGPDEKHGGLVASSINFKGKKISNKVKATDPVMFSYITAAQFIKLSARNNPKIKFDIDREFRSKLSDLFTLETSNAFTLKYDHAKKEVAFLGGDTWTFILTDVDVKAEANFAYDIPKSAITRMSLPLYTVYITENQKASGDEKGIGSIGMVSWADDMNILANFVVPYDPNRPR